MPARKVAAQTFINFTCNQNRHQWQIIIYMAWEPHITIDVNRQPLFTDSAVKSCSEERKVPGICPSNKERMTPIKHEFQIDTQQSFITTRITLAIRRGPQGPVSIPAQKKERIKLRPTKIKYSKGNRYKEALPESITRLTRSRHPFQQLAHVLYIRLFRCQNTLNSRTSLNLPKLDSKLESMMCSEVYLLLSSLNAVQKSLLQGALVVLVFKARSL